MTRFALLLHFFWVGLTSVGARQLCLNATDFGFTPKDVLRNSSFAGDDFVLTIAAGKWDSSGIGANLIKILAEDMLGIQTKVMNHGTFSSEASLQIVAGLEMKTLLSENETFRELPEAQLTMDVWQTNSRGTWNWLMNKGEFRRVLNMGDVGYSPQAAIHTFRSASEKAWSEQKIALDFYKTYISKPEGVSQYYSSVSEILELFQNYSITPSCLSDDLPVKGFGWETVGKPDEEIYLCESDGFYYPPACREGNEATGAIIPGKCVPYINGGYFAFGSTIRMAHLVTKMNVPMAMTWVQVGERNRLVFDQPIHKAVFAFWYGDHFRQYQTLNPVQVRFDKYDESSWLARNVTTEMGAVPVLKFMWGQLSDAEDQVAIMVQNYRVLMKDMLSMMMDLDTCIGSDESRNEQCRWEAACTWLKSPAGTSVWNTWMVNENDCSPGASWSGNSCELCKPGTFKTARGPQECSPCPVGTFSRVEGNRFGCTVCEAGSISTGANGPSTECELCDLDSFQDEPGQGVCHKCPAGMVSLTRRSKDCYCPPDSFDAELYGEDGGEGGRCRACPEGVVCPGHGANPVVEQGYYSDRDLNLFEGVWRCFQGGNECSGGVPGETCAPGREGLVCAVCTEGFKKGDDGACVPCGEGGVPGQAVFAIFCVAAVAMLVALYVATDVYGKGTQSHSMLAVVRGMAMAVTAAQQLSVLSHFTAVQWPEPARGLLQVFSLMTSDMSSEIQLNCSITGMSALGRFASKVAALAVVALVMLIIHVVVVVVRHGGRFQERSSSLVGSLGKIFLAFYISVISIVVGPLQCVQHPNGKRTLSADLDVVCWEDGTDHYAMIGLGMFALLVPLAFLVWCVTCVRQFPRMMLSGRTDFLHRNNFLFCHYKPQTYWYSLMYILRSLVIANLPALPNPAAQVISMQAVLVTQLLAVAYLQPWRVPVTNKLDLLFTAAVLFNVSCASYYLDTEAGQALAWVAIFVLAIPFAALPLLAAFAVQKGCKCSKKAYQYFICHDKAGAGAFARLLKMTLQKKTHGKVFLDSDDLSDPEVKFDVVGNDLETLIVVCNKSVFTRLSCVAEVTTAMVKGVGAVRLALPDFVEPDDSFVANFENAAGDLSTLTYRALNVQSACKALLWSNRLRTVRVGSLAGQRMDIVASDIVQPSGASQLLPSAAPEIAEGTSAFLVHDEGNPEATASSLVLVSMLGAAFDQHPDLVPHVLYDGSAVPQSASIVVLVCSPGSLEKESVMAVVCSALDKGALIVPVVVNDAFRFPTSSFQQDHLELAMKALASPKEAGAPTKDSASVAMEKVANIFQTIAVNFSASIDSEASLNAAARLLATRMEEHKLGKKLRSGSSFTARISNFVRSATSKLSTSKASRSSTASEGAGQEQGKHAEPDRLDLERRV